MTANPDLPWTVVAAQRDEAVRALKKLIGYNYDIGENALARIAELGKAKPPDPRAAWRPIPNNGILPLQPDSWDGKERRASERRSSSGFDRRKPQPDADGWIEWHGGECPVPDGTAYEIRYHDGWTFRAHPGHKSRWTHISDGRGGDITAYRIVEGEKP